MFFNIRASRSLVSLVGSFVLYKVDATVGYLFFVLGFGAEGLRVGLRVLGSGLSVCGLGHSQTKTYHNFPQHPTHVFKNIALAKNPVEVR